MWCWFEHIDQILVGTTKDNLPRREDMETPNASSPMHTSLVSVDVTCMDAAPITPCTRAFH